MTNYATLDLDRLHRVSAKMKHPIDRWLIRRREGLTTAVLMEMYGVAVTGMPRASYAHINRTMDCAKDNALKFANLLDSFGVKYAINRPDLTVVVDHDVVFKFTSLESLRTGRLSGWQFLDVFCDEIFPSRVDRMISEFLHRNWRSLPVVSSPDHGEWSVANWSNDRIAIVSWDFNHDVALVVDGNFADNERMQYAKQLAAWMNAKIAEDSFR